MDGNISDHSLGVNLFLETLYNGFCNMNVERERDGENIQPTVSLRSSASVRCAAAKKAKARGN